MLEFDASGGAGVQGDDRLPGTVYNYGPDALPILTEDAPQRPTTKKGKLRVEMEARLEAFARKGGQAIVLRCGDFFGPRAGNNWFAQVVQPGRRLTQIVRIGQRGLAHQWAYLPDVAETLDSVDRAADRAFGLCQPTNSRAIGTRRARR